MTSRAIELQPCNNLLEAIDILQERIANYLDPDYIDEYRKEEELQLFKYALKIRFLTFKESEEEKWQSEIGLALIDKIYTRGFENYLARLFPSSQGVELLTNRKYLYEKCKEVYSEEIRRLND